MSIKTALKFMQQARENESLRAQLQALGHAATLEDVIRLGAEAGYDFSTEEIRTAFKHDWGMRWMFYGGGNAEQVQLPAGDLEDDV